MPVHGSWTTQVGVTSQRQSEPPPPPPQRELSPYAWWVSSRSSPFAVSRYHHIIIINIIIILLFTIIIRLEIRIFRHPFSKYPTVRWKWQVRASIGTAKRNIGVCANTDRVFPPHDACVWQCIPPNGYWNELSDEQPWTLCSALFSDPDISALLWMSSSMPPPSELSSHALCVSSRSSPFAMSHHQHHRHHPQHHHHHHSTWNSDFSTSICPVPNGAMKVTGSSIHRYRKSDFGICANTDCNFFSPHDACVRQYTSKWLFK